MFKFMPSSNLVRLTYMGKFEIFKTHNQVKPSISRKSMEYEVIITTKDHDLGAILSYFFSLWTVCISVMYEFSRCSTKWMGISRRAGEFDVSLPELLHSITFTSARKHQPKLLR